MSQPPITNAGSGPDSNARTFAMLAHLLGIFTWFVGALVIWMIKREEMPFVDDQGKEALNFQITLVIGYAISVLTYCIGIGMILSLLIWVVNIVFCILAAVAANRGVAYRYPVCIRLIR
jgi:uncharacterized Tic20 family protein